MTPAIIVERFGSAVWLTIDRPPVNVLHHAALEEMSEALLAIRAMEDAKALVITGAGKAFCAGVDVADHTADRVQRTLPVFDAVIHRLLALDMPVIAAVNGAALGGGGELLLACDVVLAADNATVGQPEIQLGVFPPAAAALLPGLVGRQRAMDLILTGRLLKAAEARDVGLVTHVYPAAEFRDLAAAYVARLCELSGPVLRLAKRAVRESSTLGAHDGLERAEGLYLADLMRLRDAHEGITAFMERRKPVWSEG